MELVGQLIHFSGFPPCKLCNKPMPPLRGEGSFCPICSDCATKRKNGA